MFDILNKLVKNDEDNATGDIQLLCKLWSGESASYYFATEVTREIRSNMAFSLLGSTQIQRSSVDFRMEKGHGLLDCFLVSVPKTQKPLQKKKRKPQNTSKASNSKIFSQSLHPCTLCRDITRSYRLNVAAAELHKRLQTDHVNAVNAAIDNGEVP